MSSGNVVNASGQLITGLGTAGQTSVSFYTCILKPLAIMMAQRILANITNSLVTWIQSGFNGSPAFVTNIDDLVSNSANQAIGQFINTTSLKFLCSPFSFQIRIALATAFSSQPYSGCTLTQIDQNIQNFGNTHQAWSSWLNISTEPANNQYGAYVMASGVLSDQLNAQFAKINNEVNRNGGFLDFKTCAIMETQAQANARVVSQSQQTNSPPIAVNFSTTASTDSSANQSFDLTMPANSAIMNVNTSAVPQCLHETTQTPGSAIQSALAAKYGADFNSLGLATDIDQVIGALVNELVSKTLTGAGGLLGAKTQSVSNSADLSAIAASQSSSNADVINSLNSQASSAVNIAASTETGSNNTNLATNAVITTSSVGVGSNPKNANDGDVTTTFVSGNEQRPSFSLDLGSSKSFNEIQVGAPYPIITNLGKIEVEISNSGTFDITDSSTLVWDSVSNTFVSPVSTGTQIFNATSSPTFTINVPATAEYVKIIKASDTGIGADGNCHVGFADSSGNCTDPLQISEIQIISTSASNITSPTVTTSSGTNPAPAVSFTGSPTVVTIPLSKNAGTVGSYSLLISTSSSSAISTPVSATITLTSQSGAMGNATADFSQYSLMRKIGGQSSNIDSGASLLGAGSITLSNLSIPVELDIKLQANQNTDPGTNFNFTVNLIDGNGEMLGTNTENFVIIP